MKPPEAKVTGYEVKSISLEKAVLNFSLDVNNPNGIGLDKAYLAYEFSVGEIDLLKEKDIVVSIPANETKTNFIPITLDYEKVFTSATQLINTISSGTTTQPYLLKGAIRIEVAGIKYEIPFSESGEIPLPSVNDITPEQIQSGLRDLLQEP